MNTEEEIGKELAKALQELREQDPQKYAFLLKAITENLAGITKILQEPKA